MKDILTIDFLSEVLCENISDFSIIGNNINYIIENYETEEDGELVYIDLGTNININDLIDRCIDKYKSEYTFGVFTDIDSQWCNIWKYGTEDNARPFLGNTKLESVIKACQYIYNIKKETK